MSFDGGDDVVVDDFVVVRGVARVDDANRFGVRVRVFVRVVLFVVDVNVDGGDVIDGVYGYGVVLDFGVVVFGVRDEMVVYGVRFVAYVRERLGLIRRVVVDVVVGECGVE